jgi:hypothetical protein
MAYKNILAAVAALTLVTAPTVAAAQSAPAPATETVEGEQLRGGFIIPLVALVAIILGILAATNDNDDDLPTSP